MMRKNLPRHCCFPYLQFFSITFLSFLSGKFDLLFDRQTKIMNAIVQLKQHIDERFGALPIQVETFEIKMVSNINEMNELEQNLADPEYLEKFVRNHFLNKS